MRVHGYGDETAGVCPFSGAGAGDGGTTRSAVSRRAVLAGLAGIAALPVMSGTALAAPPRRPPAPTQSPAAPPPARRPRAARGAHAVGNPRGSDIAVRAGRDAEARFGLMFKKLPAFAPPDALLTALAVSMNDGKAPLSDVKDSDVAFDNPGMPAGYIYLGQFIDHDMTLDKTPLTQQQQDPRATTNYDTPRFDLASVYGRGPAGSPELYDPARPGYLLCNDHDGVRDLPRDDVGAACLGDPRNDENLIVAQFHAVFLRLHNKLRDEGKTFEQAQQLVRWHYQWLIVNDYLPRIVGRDVVDRLVRRRRGGPIEFLGRFYKPRNPRRPYMPVEYSGAAYRFGHSMIRAEYEVHDQHTVPIFGNEGHQDLRGNRPVPADLWIDWNYFFEIPGMSTPDDRNMARLIDTQLSLPLSTLPPTVVAPTAGAITSLAERNLLRGKRLGLPAGQDVAVAMGLEPLTNQQLGLTDPGWKGKAPLWFYVLKEAELLGGHRLGPVGGTIVAEVILGLMACDTASYFTANPGFDPGAGYSMGHLLLWADAIDPRAFEVPEEEDPEDGAADEDEIEDEEPHEEESEVEEPEDDEEPELLEPGEAPDPAATSPVPGPVV
ncbi:Animal haem peroxidase [Geodermatophilus obscurus]|uniref:Animal haem peroxidase n=1 Tax=Geodermatophilus obscurus TaxID=1861 RepID=A0A1M7TKR1_9ACTN|nr:heme peroxidase family protein [Geodermatophilus obscurus]SHN71286.1 Animal haem peroxidase [Geodermatophilus obscurus]